MLRTLAMAKLGLAPPPLSPATTKRVADGMAEAAATAAAAEPAGLATEKTDVRVSMEQRSAAEAIAVGEGTPPPWPLISRDHKLIASFVVVSGSSGFGH